jgi:dynein heavy chain
VAGSLKRSDRGRPEDQVLMRALRDFNTPKIISDDVPIFMGLIADLFPALDVPRKRDMDFEACVKQSVLVSSNSRQFINNIYRMYLIINLIIYTIIM